MSESTYTVKEFATMTGVTERTLRYYDRIELLKPSKYSEKGHRLYVMDDIEKIQKILTLKYLGYSLSEIQDNLIENSNHHLHETLKLQKEMLLKKREEIDIVIRTISKAESLVQNKDIDNQLLLTIIHSIQHENTQKKYFEKHLSKKLVDQAFLENRPEEERIEIEQQFVQLLADYQEFQLKGYKPSNAQVQELTQKLFIQIEEIFTPEMVNELEGLQDETEGLLQFSFIPQAVQSFIEESVRVFEKNHNCEGLLKGFENSKSLGEQV
ncbi:MerR family transcriptional regulator [Cytobacillus sp. FJAT-54145]|uniref:MerR family transcriptional regulator n=1 Tax=Cytobacillus spartinae TaxID=3299023 RepID=A0ABW6K6P6_9BACI